MDKDITKHYSSEDLTIVWKPSLCIHAKKCWRTLPDVFQPAAKPWINIDGATSEAIMDTIAKCPSGALTWKKNETAVRATEGDVLKIEILPDGPIVVRGSISIQHTDGKTEDKEQTTALCRCGASGNKPYCDGTHRKIEFKG